MPSFKRNSREKFTLRKRLWERARGVCWVCERYVPLHEATVDHVHPSSRGGKTAARNVRIACRACNNGRGSEDAAAWALRVLRVPEKHAERIRARAAFAGLRPAERDDLTC